MHCGWNEGNPDGKVGVVGEVGVVGIEGVVGVVRVVATFYVLIVFYNQSLNEINSNSEFSQLSTKLLNSQNYQRQKFQTFL